MPPAASSAGPEAIELAASAGLFLDDWQRQAVIDLLGEDTDGYWAATSGGIICPRQNGKGSIIEALELAWLFLCGVDLIFHSAHLFSTSQDAFRRIKSLIRDTPDLDAQVKRYSEAHGHEGIELHSGQRLRFVARSKSGGRGFPAPVVVLDEAFNLSTQAMAALVPTMAAQDNPFLLVTSSAPIDDPCSDVLRDYMRAAREGVDRQVYIEYSADRDAPFEQQLEQANPGWLIRLNQDVIDVEQRLLTPAAFVVERLGIVDLEEEARGWQVITEHDWLRNTDPLHTPSGSLRYALDVDVNAKGEQWASIGMSDGTHVELVTPLEVGPGTDWVVPACVKRKDEIGELLVAKDSRAAALVDALEAKGVTVRKVKPEEFVQASMQIIEACTQGTLRHIDQPALNRAVAGAATKDVGDGQRKLSRTLATADIGPFCAVAMAKWAAALNENPPSVYEEREMVVL